ncbi:MAG TPA: GvpL/GvpF family gas vesicle protein [Pseudomonadales bacterium]|nr:GvpL/GvpF family gas vesicle protein [Pseudomonadales bacterium]
MTARADGHATYLYGLLQRRDMPDLAGAPRGLPLMGQPRVLAAGPSLWLVVADAPLRHYAGPTIDGHLTDLGWVSECAMAHEAVVEHAATLGTVVPMKLFTLFSTDARAVTHVARRRNTLARVIRRVAGRQEWGIQIRRTADPPTPRPARALTGTAFLQRKRREAAARRAGGASTPTLRAALTELRRVAGSIQRRPIAADATGAGGLILDVVLLVAVRRRARFLRTIARVTARLAREGYAVTVTGPWPPYHFIGRG